MIASNARAAILRCHFELVDYGPIKTRYACKVISINAEEPSTVDDIKGDHRSAKNNSDVEALWVENNPELSSIPSNIEHFFPNLITISWFSGNLKTITADDLKPFPKLIRIYLSYNKIETLDGDLFQYTPKMQRIHLNENLVSNVGVDFLADLTELARVDLRMNTCININADTADKIEDLKQQLVIMCPPLATEPPPTTDSQTEFDACLPRCSLNYEADDLHRRADSQEERIAELEKLVREINANSCSCTTTQQD